MNDTAASIAPFDQRWSRDQTQRWMQLCADMDNAKGEAYSQWRADFDGLQAQLYDAVAGHLLDLASRHGLTLPPHAEGLQSLWMDPWRKACAAQPLESHDRYRLGAALYIGLARTIGACQNQTITQDAVDQAHAALVAKVASGDFELFEVERQQCQASGESISVEFTGWVPSLLRFDQANRRFVPLAAGDITAPGLEHLVIDLPSGQLLASDWFRHPAFNAVTEQVLQDSPSINSAQGCVERTRRLASLGVASVFVGNSCPTLVSGDGGVRVGWIDEDEVSGDQRGSICTDLWWATLVDKQVLVDLFARAMSIDQARSQVEELIANQASDILQVDLAPGRYHLYFAGSPEIFAAKFNADEVDFAGFNEPMFALCPKELAPTPARAGKRPAP